MIVAWKNVCQHCGYVVTTAGDIEYYLDAEGERKIYGHPRAASQEALERGVYGIYDKLWCPTCDIVSEYVIWEAFEPVMELQLVWHYVHTLGRRVTPVCSACGGILLFDLTDLQCPHCQEGHFKVKEVWRA